MDPNLPAAQQIPWYMQGVAPTMVHTMPAPGSPLLPGQTPPPFMAFARPGAPPAYPPAVNVASAPVMPQGGGLFSPGATAPQAPMAGMFGGMSAPPPTTAIGQLGIMDRLRDGLRNNQMMVSGIASGLLDKKQNNNTTWGQIFERGAVGHEMDEDRQEKETTKRRFSVTTNLIKQKFGYDDATADAVAGTPELLNDHIKRMSGPEQTTDIKNLVEINRQRKEAGLPTYRLDEWDIAQRQASRAPSGSMNTPIRVTRRRRQ
jgi:hypothetical protein